MRCGLTLVLLLAACKHSQPFPLTDYGGHQPFAPGSPRRLTFNLGNDYAPGWLADGSSILYSVVRLDTPHFDRCLGLLPATGGTLSRVMCDRAVGYGDSVTVFEESAAAADGRLAYVASRSSVGALAPTRMALVLGTLAIPAPADPLQTTPFPVPDGAGIAQVRWLDAGTLVYLAERVDHPAKCRFCPPDTVRTGLDVVRVALGGATPLAQVVPGTLNATSVTPGESADVVYYTVSGESRVHRRVLSSGADSVVHDFGTGMARDVSFAAGRLAVVVGGNVSVTYDSTLGHAVQRDSGGPLHVVDLASGRDTILASVLPFRRPALSPSGKQLVAEAVAGNLDLWLFDLP
ncbi:MAG TPA: hypothetical protein VH116_09860 [Gemmatimonadales bacterium]|jgi:hypothetical protein|nr:hypothetical protein [Gemmatimonadales bacterium]